MDNAPTLYLGVAVISSPLPNFRYSGENFAAYRLIPSGTAGILATLDQMVRLSRAGRRDPAIRKKAFEILQRRGVANRDWNGELTALHGFVQDTIRYVRDPVDTLGEHTTRGIETLATPAATLKYGAGDCDEHSVLLSALLGAIGHPSRFCAIAVRGGKFSHVYTESPTAGGTWLAAETTEPVKLGWRPMHVTRRLERYAT